MNLILFGQSECKGECKSECTSSASAFLPKRDERAVHLLKVLRKKPGDRFEAGILEGRLGSGFIKEINAEGIECSLTLDTEPPCRTPIRLGVGFPRPIQIRRLLRDCASLGLAAVDLISTELGEKSYRNTKLLDNDGGRAALIEGAIQARDTRLPQLAVYSSLAAWLETSGQGPLGTKNKKSDALLAAADNVNPQDSFSGIGPFDAAVLAVGSERGWSSRERDLLEAKGFIRLSMGTRALRTETACTAALILLMEKMGLL